ncbi:MAG: ABC transporter permease [Gemmatimonadales bacterium]|nr:ABC transporter permease [Gemmatimonadales bacterium]
MSFLARLLLRLYPAAFRAEFGDELAQVARDAWHDAGRGPRSWPARCSLLLDLLRGAMTERLAASPSPPIPPRQPRLTMRDLLMEFRYAFRSLARTPGFSVAVILTLGLGIGANTAIFSVVDGVLLRPAPFQAMESLTMVWETDRKSGTFREPASIPDYFDLVARTKQYERLAAFMPAEVNLTPDAGDPARLVALAVSHRYLPMVGITPVAGRVFSEEEDRAGAARVAMIGEAMWAERFARNNSVLGSTIRLNDVAHVIVGVLPATADFGTLQVLGAAAYARGFADRGGRVRVDIWLPLRADPATAQRGNHPIFVMGRLNRTATASLAQQEMTTIAADLERTYPHENDARGIHVEALSDVVFGGVRPALLVLVGAVALVLLVACANVANLLLARGTSRMREVTVRAALGASVGRLTRQFLVESAVLTGLGVVVGLVLAVGGLRLLMALAPASIPRVGAVGIDGRVLVVTLGLATLVGVVFGMVPALQARRRGPQLTMQREASRGASVGREHGRLRSALVVAELALAVVLMIGAGLLIKSIWQLSQVDPGFRAQGVLKAEFQLPASRYPQRFEEWPHWREARQFNDELRRRVSMLPGVTAVTIAGNHPLEAGFTSSIVVIGREAEAEDWPEPTVRRIDPGYLSTMVVPLVKGRPFAESDDPEATPVILINAAARDRFFGAQDPLGQKVRLWGAERIVVGVVADERFKGQAEAAAPALYLSTTQAPIAGGSLLVRVGGDATQLAPAVRSIVRELDPALPLFGVEPLADTLADSTGQRRFTMLVLGVFAAVALLLAMIGVHGVLSYTVAQRTREIGIRMALGADRSTVRALVLGQGARLAAAGLAIGLAGAMGVARLLGTLLFGVHPNDPMTFIVVAAGLGTVALVASWLPARRAARMEPLVALRE